jgi:glycosyltransferase involved in cell wall biosynthesis
MKVILLGSAYPFRGGLAAYNERLIQEFGLQGHDASIITFTLQYPSIFFPGTTQYSSSEQPKDIEIERKLSSVNPISWMQTGKKIAQIKPDVLLIKYWLPFMAPAFGTVARLAKRNKHTKVICIVDNIIPHEPKFYDRIFTKWFVNSCDGFITMSNTVLKDLAIFDRKKMRASNPHPLFDNFGERISRSKAAEVLGLNPNNRYILFFGFIRDYKGLDLAIKAMDKLQKEYDNIHLIIAGESYTDAEKYKEMISHELSNRIHWWNRFISDEEVTNFFSLADLVLQPYKKATQSGITQIAYHFEVPMIVTNVGGLPELVPDGECGIVVPPDELEIAKGINRFYTEELHSGLTEGIRQYKLKFGWDRLVNTIIDLSTKI